MKDAVLPGCLCVTADFKADAGGITKSGLSSVEVGSSGHWWVLCVDVIIVAGCWSAVEWVGPVLNLSIGDVAVTVQQVNVHAPSLPKCWLVSYSSDITSFFKELDCSALEHWVVPFGMNII